MKESLINFILFIFGTISVYFAPTIPLIFMVGVFIAADTVMGLYASWKLNQPILSRKFARLITKLISYTASVLLVYILDINLLCEFIEKPLLVTKVSAGVLAFVELFSIDEKIRKLNNNKGIVYYITKVFEFVKNIKDKHNEIINK
jgi:hypothetical protein